MNDCSSAPWTAEAVPRQGTLPPDGSIGHEITPEDDEQRGVTRHIHSRVLLNYHTARAVLEWLEDRVAALEEEGPPDMYDTDSGIEQ